MRRVVLLLFVYFCAGAVVAATVFTCPAPESAKDTRRAYDNALLELALKKTEAKYGAYTLERVNQGANNRRNRLDVGNRVYPNFFIKESFSLQLKEKLAYVPIPVDRGIVGYRVAFVSKETGERLKKVTSLEELKQFSVVQGIGWLDADILEKAGFKVQTGSSYEGMFEMVAANRADLFFRGVNELLSEWEAHQQVANLAYDESVLVHYPLPRFFYTAKANTEAIERVHEGLKMAYEDGSFEALWQQHYMKSIEFVGLGKRKVFEINNPYTEGLDPAYTKYNYVP